jgi:O-antigen/teichoic acid export membrane protein
LTQTPKPLTPLAGAPSAEEDHLSLRRNFAWTLAGNVFYAACQWGILIAIAKLGTPAMLGEFALGLAISAPVFMFTTLQLRAVLATDIRDEYRLGHYLAVRILGTAIGLIAIAGFVAVAGFQREAAIVVFLVSLAKAAETFSDIVYGFWQKHERFDRIAIALMGRGTGSLAGVAAVLYFTRSIAWSIAAMAAVWTLWLVTYERAGAKHLLARVSLQDRLRPQWQWNKCKSVAVLALPLGVVLLLLSLNANIPRYFVEHYLGEAALGYFAAMAYVLVAGNTVMAAIGQSVLPRLARHFRLDPAAFVRLLKNMVLIGAALGIAGIGVAFFWGPMILRLLYRADYAEYAAVFTWLMTAAAVAYVASMLGYGMMAARVFRAQVPLFLISTTITALACWVLIPSSGLMGSAYAMLIGAVIPCAGSGYIIFAALRSRPAGIEV